MPPEMPPTAYTRPHIGRRFISIDEMPEDIRVFRDGCGIWAAYGVLRHFDRECSLSELVDRCKWTKKDGIFAIALACALRSYGLDVEFFSSRDDKIQPIERSSYLKAAHFGIKVNEAIDLNSLLSKVSFASVPIVLFWTGAYGHLSPLLGEWHNHLIIPYWEKPLMPRDEFLAQWGNPNVVQQCLVVSDRERRIPNVVTPRYPRSDVLFAAGMRINDSVLTL